MATIAETFTISKIMEINARGEKNSEFLSVKFKSDVSLTRGQLIMEQLEAHETVEEAIVFNCLASGMITQETAKDKLAQVKERHAGILAVLRKRYGAPDPSGFLEAEVPETEEKDDPTERR